MIIVESNIQRTILQLLRIFDLTEISPSKQAGNTITFNISSTTGTPDGAPSATGGSTGYVIFIADLISTDGSLVKKVYDFKTTSKSVLTYEIGKFPAKMFGTLSNGQTFELDLYKCAKWTVRLYINK
jgi:predicted RNA-binding protein with TRAM domain